MNIFKRARIIYVLQRYAIKHDLWLNVSESLTVLQNMSAVEKAHLRELSTLFLYEKNIFAVQGLQLTDEMRVIIAVQACLPILGLSISLFSRWSDVIIYPDAFQVNRDVRDEYGFIHHEKQLLSGESWARGPVIFSWCDIEKDRQRGYQGHNVIVHEIAHKLDALNGRVNGMPALHYSMQTVLWTETFSQSYEKLNQQLDYHQRPYIDPYAATSPAEFFAVFSECFFSAPQILNTHFNDIYQQLKLYYRQDPANRFV